MRVDEVTAKRWATDEYEIVCLPHLLIVVCHNSGSPTVKPKWAYVFRGPRDILAGEGMPGLTDDASFYRVDKNFTEAYSILQNWYQNEIAPVSA